MEDSTNTVIVTGIGKNIKKEDFVNHFKHIGNIIKSNMRTERLDGIVTYDDPEMAKQAAETLNDSSLKGSVINVVMADSFYNHHSGGRDHITDGEINTAWHLWAGENECQHGVEQHWGGGKGDKGGHDGPNIPSGHNGEDREPRADGKEVTGGKPAVHGLSDNGWQYDKNNEQGGGGGKGDKEGSDGSNAPSGHDGEDGESGPNGKGGAGGKPAVPGLADNGLQYDRNNEQGRGGGKGDKGGSGGPNVPSGHDGEDGESGPGGKGGEGGKPAVTSLADNGWQYDRNNKQGGGGGKGGKGGSGGPNTPSGHDGEDGEPGPGGKGGAGGKPAVSNACLGKRTHDCNGSGNNVGLFTKMYNCLFRQSKEGENEKKPVNDNDLKRTDGGKGGKGGKGSYGIKNGHDGEDGESGPSGKGGKGGKPAL